MTNTDYIKSNLKDVDLAELLRTCVTFSSPSSEFLHRAYRAWSRWANTTSGNHGNMAKGIYKKSIVNEDPSIWFWEWWHYPDGEWRRSGRTSNVSLQVWLSKQYNPAEWVEEEERE